MCGLRRGADRVREAGQVARHELPPETGADALNQGHDPDLEVVAPGAPVGPELVHGEPGGALRVRLALALFVGDERHLDLGAVCPREAAARLPLRTEPRREQREAQLPQLLLGRLHLFHEVRAHEDPVHGPRRLEPEPGGVVLGLELGAVVRRVDHEAVAAGEPWGLILRAAAVIVPRNQPETANQQIARRHLKHLQRSR